MNDSSRPTHSSASAVPVKPFSGDVIWNAKQVAETLNLSRRTVTYLAGLGDLPGFKVGRAWRFWRNEILEYLEQHRGERLLAE